MANDMVRMRGFLLQWCMLGIALVGGNSVRFLSPSAVHYGTIGQDVILPCRISFLVNEYGVMWRKLNPESANQDDVIFAERTAMTRDNRFELVSSADPSNYDLKIKRLEHSDAATYVCSITTDPQLDQQQVLHVKSPPSVSTIPEKSPTVVEIGGSFHLTCLSNGNPKPKITWTRSDGPLPENVKFSPDSGDLYFENANVENAGIYTCTAENGVGKAMDVDIEVQINNPNSNTSPPNVTVAAHSMDVMPKESFSITCNYYANPAPSVEWFFNGYKIEPDGSRSVVSGNRGTNPATSTLTIKEATEDDFGNFTCRIVNHLGKAEATVTVTGLPEPARLKVEPNQNDGFLLHWSVDSAQPILEYQLDYKEFGQANYSTVTIPADSNVPIRGKTYEAQYDIEKLQPEMTYEFVLRAKNKLGWGRPVQETIKTGKLQTYRRQADHLSVSTKVPKDSQGVNGGSSLILLSPISLFAVALSLALVERLPVL